MSQHDQDDNPNSELDADNIEFTEFFDNTEAYEKALQEAEEASIEVSSDASETSAETSTKTMTPFGWRAYFS